MSCRFVADVGGTNIRLAQVDNGQLINIRKYLCNDFSTIGEAIKQYFSEMPDSHFTAGCIAIACPVNSDEVRMTNHTWAFSISKLQQELELQHLDVINDFASVAYSLPVLTDEQKVQIGGGAADPKGNIAVFGPGTGLGVKHLTLTDQGWQALDGEGGHVDFAPYDDTDLPVWQYLVRELGRASAEEVMSGRGIVNIYRALAEDRGEPARFDDPADITPRALSGESELCKATLRQFCRIMGSFGGNLALNLCTTGGVYIGGGIASRFINFIKDSEFRQRFEAKGKLHFYVKDIPVFIINEPDHGLLGAAAYLEQHYKG